MWESFANSTVSVLIMAALAAVGYFCSAKGWMPEDAKKFISKLLVNIVVPCMTLYGLCTNLTHELLSDAWKYLLAVFAMQLPLYPISYLIGKKVLGLDDKHVPIFAMMCTVSNTMGIGYPMCLQLFDEACIPYVMFFYTANVFTGQGLCQAMIARGAQGETSLGSIFKNLLKVPSMWAVLLGVLLVIFQIKLPGLAMKTLSYMNNMVTPLSMLVVGDIIYETNLKTLKIDKVIGTTLLFRFVLSFALCYAVTKLFGVGGLGRDVFLVEAMMPCQAQCAIFAVNYGADESLGARGVAVTTLACFIVIPLLMLIIPLI